MAHKPAKKKQKIDAENNATKNIAADSTPLWDSNNVNYWEDKVGMYHTCIRDQVAGKMKKQESRQRLIELDHWYYDELPKAVEKRRRAGSDYLTCEELVDITEWKMLRGIWRAKNKGVSTNTRHTHAPASHAPIHAHARANHTRHTHEWLTIIS